MAGHTGLVATLTSPLISCRQSKVPVIPGFPGFAMPNMPVPSLSHRLWLLAVAAAVSCAGSGCTTVLSTASLRDLVLGIDDRVDDSAIPTLAEPEASGGDVESDSADAERRAAAIEEAINRLSKVGELDDDARTTLVTTLQRTNQEDWPVVVEAFAESLAGAPATHVVAKADLDTGSAAGEEPSAIARGPAKEAEPEAPPASMADPMPKVPIEPDALIAPAVAVSVAPDPEPVPQPEPTPPAEPTPEPVTTSPPAPSPSLMIRNAAFASRVQAWGVLDRFEADRFRPGQEVIVYFELENLSSGESPAGHTTCIDARLRCITSTGDVVHEWKFEPIAETCRARRHDYFARYMVRIPPEAKPGIHRIELAVTDTLSGHEAVEALDLEIAPAQHAAE